MQKPNAKSLCLLKKDKEGYYLDHAAQVEGGEEESVDRLWLVARSLKNEGGKYDYKIQKFDAIKLGRVRFRVKDFRCDKLKMSQDELYNQEQIALIDDYFGAGSAIILNDETHMLSHTAVKAFIEKYVLNGA